MTTEELNALSKFTNRLQIIRAALQVSISGLELLPPAPKISDAASWSLRTRQAELIAVRASLDLVLQEADALSEKP